MAANTVQINVTAQDNTAQGLGEAQSSLSDFGTKAAGILGAAGAAAGAVLIQGITNALEQGKITSKLGAQLGATPDEAKKYGELAGELYSDAITEDFQGAADAIKATMQSGLLPADATNAQIKSISTKVADLANTFDQDLGGVTNAVGQMMRTGLAKNADEAFDIITAGMQNGANKADDLLDTFNEYGTQFRNVGLTGQEAMGLITQGLQAGARDADVVADSIKEFSIEAVAGGERVRGGFESLGLNADEMVAKFAEGGPAAAQAFDVVLDKLRDIEDPAKRNAVAIELFGTKAEDMGDALFALDPSKAVDTLGQVGGAAEDMGNTLRDNAGIQLEQFKRNIEQNVVEFLGGTVIPAVLGFKETFLGSFADIWTTAGEGSTGLGDQIVNAFGNLGEQIKEKFTELAPQVFEAVTGLGQDIADYIMENPMEALKIALIANAILIAFMLLPALIAAGIGALVVMIVGGFVAKLITVLAEKLPEWWSAFTGWVAEKAGQAGSTLVSWGNAIANFFSGLWGTYIAGPISKQWSSLLSNIRELPGRITSALSGIGSTTATIGRQIIEGMISGVKSMAGNLVSAAKGVVSGAINGAKALLGISSPSKVFKKIGEQTGEGMELGLESMSPQVGAAAGAMASGAIESATLVNSPVRGASAANSQGFGGASSAMQITLMIGDKTVGDLIIDPLRKIVRSKGGNVQAVIGS